MQSPFFPQEVANHFRKSHLARALEQSKNMKPWSHRASMEGLELDWERYERVDMLASLCPNLEELEAGADRWNDVLFGLSPGSLARLRHVALTHLHWEDGRSFAQLGQVVAVAPRLSRLICFRVSQTVRDMERLPTFAYLTELRLYRSAVGPTALRRLLAACPQLRLFTYTAGGCWIGPDQASPLDFQRAILRYVPNLVSLTLDVSYADTDNDSDIDTSTWSDDYSDSGTGSADRKDPRVITSLAELTSLEYLALDMRCLLPDPSDLVPMADSMLLVSVLPTSIRSLRITQDTAGSPLDLHPCGFEPLRRPLRRLASAAPDGFPLLKDVTLCGAWDEDIEDLRFVFKRQGVSVRWERTEQAAKHTAMFR
ncbi:hypothetical protein VTI74DRAFT_5795 [Chaetomium olivicolor]